MNINQFGYFFDEDIRLIDESYVKISLQLRFFFLIFFLLPVMNLRKGENLLFSFFFLASLRSLGTLH